MGADEIMADSSNPGGPRPVDVKRVQPGAKSKVRFGSMLLKKSASRADDATIESTKPAIRINVAPATGLLNQSCVPAPSKSFFNTIGHEVPLDKIDAAAGPPQ
jgi:hypothetical protein